MISCTYARPTGREAVVRCTIGHYGGFPSIGVCRVACQYGKHPEHPARPAKSAAALANQETCAKCGGQPNCPIWKLFPCNRAKALRGDPRYPCPEGKLTMTS